METAIFLIQFDIESITLWWNYHNGLKHNTYHVIISIFKFGNNDNIDKKACLVLQSCTIEEIC